MTSSTAARRGPRAAAASQTGVVTLQQVAERAGVSPSTVSRILNGTAVVSEDKQKAVADAIAELGFVPNPVARGLAGGRTLSVGVVTQSLDSPFYGGALRGIEDTLHPAGYMPLFTSGHWEAKAEKQCVDVLRSRRVDGLIVLTGRMSDEVLKTVAKELPVVITGRRLNAAGLFSLSFDDEAGARMAVEHLLQLGHRRIVFIRGHQLHPDAEARERGFRAAMSAAAVPVDEALVLQGDYLEDSGLSGVERLLDQGAAFSAIFAANDQMSFGAALALHRRGLRVPHDVSLVGFDDLPSSAYTLPPLTTVHQPIYDLGKLAATVVLGMLAGREPDAVLPPPRLVVRASTAVPAAQPA